MEDSSGFACALKKLPWGPCSGLCTGMSTDRGSQVVRLNGHEGGWASWASGGVGQAIGVTSSCYGYETDAGHFLRKCAT